MDHVRPCAVILRGKVGKVEKVGKTKKVGKVEKCRKHPGELGEAEPVPEDLVPEGAADLALAPAPDAAVAEPAAAVAAAEPAADSAPTAPTKNAPQVRGGRRGASVKD
jgi:hypothetical protein